MHHSGPYAGMFLYIILHKIHLTPNEIRNILVMKRFISLVKEGSMEVV